MSDYPFFIPEVVLCANSSLFWFKVANEHREFRNYLMNYTYKNKLIISYYKIITRFFKLEFPQFYTQVRHFPYAVINNFQKNTKI